MKSSMFHKWADVLCPNKHCLLCHQTSNTLICEVCSNDLNLIDHEKCRHNLLRIPKIRQGLKVPLYDELLCLAEYQSPFPRLIRQLKFSHKLLHANALAKLFVEHLDQQVLSVPDLIVPVPLHPKRFAKRYYNQAFQIAQQISKDIKVPVLANPLQRVKHTQAQTSLNATQRKQNLEGAFALKTPIKANHMVLFDDVITTGETVNAVCRVLRKAYPTMRIDLWTICISLDRR